MKKHNFFLGGISVTGTVAKYHISEIYQSRGFGVDESQSFFNECLRDDVIGQVKRDQFLQHDLLVTLEDC